MVYQRAGTDQSGAAEDYATDSASAHASSNGVSSSRATAASLTSTNPGRRPDSNGWVRSTSAFVLVVAGVALLNVPSSAYSPA